MGLLLMGTSHRRIFACAALSALVVVGCHHTWQGVKEDTRNAVDKTGHGLEKAGKKMQGKGEKKDANKGNAGGAPSRR